MLSDSFWLLLLTNRIVFSLDFILLEYKQQMNANEWMNAEQMIQVYLQPIINHHFSPNINKYSNLQMWEKVFT